MTILGTNLYVSTSPLQIQQEVACFSETLLLTFGYKDLQSLSQHLNSFFNARLASFDFFLCTLMNINRWNLNLTTRPVARFE